MTVATSKSGHALPVPKTPSAASMTKRFPSASLREQIHTDRMFASPVRKRYSIHATPPLANSAITPTAPMVTGSGAMPCCKCQTAFASTKIPKPPMHAALSSAAFERAESAMPSTASDSA